MTLTREQVEAALRMLQQAERDGASITGLRLDELTQAYRLALQALDMQPRPISECTAGPDEPVDLVVRRPLSEGGSLYRVADATRSLNGTNWLRGHGYIEGRLFRDEDDDWAFDSNDRGPEATVVTHFIPRLPLPEGGKE